MHGIIKYTVFISSTFDDLKGEREQVADAILKLGHIPCGMEQFSAGSGRGWDVITQTIDICDYYVILVAGRYGTLFPNEQLSWTEKEYDYARSRGLDPLAFLRHKDHIIGSRMDDEPSAVASRHAFLKRIEDECRRELWTTGDDLCARVTMALTKQISDDQRLGKQRPGWFRGDDLPGNPQVTNELARLSSENADLRAALARAQTPQVPILEILTMFGNSVPEKLEFQLTEYSETPSEQKGEMVMLTPGALDNAKRRASKWLEELSRLFWIRLQIANSGPVPARDVRVRVAVPEAGFAALNRVSSKKHRLLEGTCGPKQYSSTEVVSHHETQGNVVFHTIPRLSTNRTLVLTPMAFFATGSLMGEGQIVKADVVIDDESGALYERRLYIHLTAGPRWSGDEAEIQKHANSSRAMLKTPG